MHQVMRDVKLPRAKLDGVVRRRLRNVLVSAYWYVHYYRELMQSVGYNPVRNFHGPEDLSRLPITTKEVFKEGGIKAFVKDDSDLSQCFSDSTSGSTGIPIKVYQSSYERAVHIAKWLRVLFLNGYSVRHRVMAITRPRNIKDERSIIQRFGILRRLAVDQFLPTEKIVNILLESKPDVLYGNRSHLDLTALELKRRGKEPKGLKLVVGTGEVIYDSSRKLCREQFGVELVESYGSTEMGVMAYETPAHDGLHLCEDLTYFEFLSEEGKPVPPGEPARVVVTDLTGKLMPFIRYDQGDRAVFQDVKDGSGNTVRRITRIFGREDDYIVLPNGSRRPYNDINRIISSYSDIFQYRIVQRERTKFKILVVADTSYLVGIRDDLLCRLHEKFPTVNFDIFQVKRIEPDPSGKLRKFISEVD